MTGEGITLLVYDVVAQGKLTECDVFTANSIHGMTCYNSCVAVFGGKCLRIIQLQDDGHTITVASKEISLSDWIWSIQWLSGESILADPPVLPGYLAAALGHNAVVMVDWSTGGVVREVHCQDKCILYSAHFIGNRWGNLVLSAGTVFNQVILWPMAEPSCDQNIQSEQRAKVIHRLTGHQGVIFSITTNATRCQLCSVSDDRSLRLWQVKGHDTNQPLFDWSVQTWHGAKFELLHVLYGHTARVWKGVLLSNRIISVGEDATCLVWNYEGEIEKKLKGHKGRSIWSVACSEGERFLATGGGDTSIRISCLEQSDPGGGVDVSYNSQNLQPCDDPEDFPRIVKLLEPDSLVVMTNKGLLRHYDLLTDMWCTLVNDSHFYSYCVLATGPGKPMFALASIRGLIKVFSSDGSMITEQQVFDGKVFNLLWLESTSEDNMAQPSKIRGCEMEQLLATGPDGHVVLLEFALSAIPVVLRSVRHFRLPHTKQRWVSAACVPATHPILVCGDRGGTVHVYNLSDAVTYPDEVTPDNLASPIQSLPKIHGKVGVTDVRYHDNHVYTCGRDGHYRVYHVTMEGLQTLQANRAIKGWDWLTGLYFVGDDILVMGFHMEKFVLHSLNQSESLLSISCGGGHRAWDFGLDKSVKEEKSQSLPSHSLEGVTVSTGGWLSKFVYIKNREVIICDANIKNRNFVLKPALHGRAINDVVCVFPDSCIEKGFQDDYEVRFAVLGSSCLLATSGEDGQVNLVSYDSRVLSTISILQGHISSVRCLATSQSGLGDSDSCKVLYSGGGRAQLLIWRIWRQKNSFKTPAGNSCDSKPDFDERSERLFIRNDCKANAPEMVCHDWSEHLSSHTVIEDGGVRKKKTWKSLDVVADPETRVMSVTAFSIAELDPDLDGCMHIVITGCSDTTLRIFLYNERTRKLLHIYKTGYHNHCVLCVKHVIMTSANQRRALVLSAGTGGRVALWDITSVVLGCANQLQTPDNTHSKGSGIFPTASNTAMSSTVNCSIAADRKISDCGGASCLHGISSISIGNPDWSSQCHQSGVSAMDVRQTADNSLLLVTGGDDNAIQTTELEVCEENVIDQGQKLKVTRSYTKKDAHSAQITGIHILGAENVMSVSIDQRAIWWKIDASNLQVIPCACCWHSVADTASLAVWKCRGNITDGSMWAGTTGIGHRKDSRFLRRTIATPDSPIGVLPKDPDYIPNTRVWCNSMCKGQGDTENRGTTEPFAT